jgi:hypothetical protein
MALMTAAAALQSASGAPYAEQNDPHADTSCCVLAACCARVNTTVRFTQSLHLLQVVAMHVPRSWQLSVASVQVHNLVALAMLHAFWSWQVTAPAPVVPVHVPAGGVPLADTPGTKADTPSAAH